MADTRLSTPVGTLVFPALKYADTKFDELGQYKGDLSVPLAEAEPLMKQLSGIFKAHTGKAPKKNDNVMWYFQTDDEGEETGNVIFKIRVKNRISKKTGEKWDRRPKLFSADLKPIDVNPWGGSRAIVSFDVYEWDAGGKKGVSLQIVAVQIIELIEGGSGGPSASSFGFDKKDGYVAPDTEGLEAQEPPEVEDEYDDTLDGADY